MNKVCFIILLFSLSTAYALSTFDTTDSSIADTSKKVYEGKNYRFNFIDFCAGFRPGPEIFLHLWGKVGDEIDYDNSQDCNILILYPYINNCF